MNFNVNAWPSISTKTEVTEIHWCVYSVSLGSRCWRRTTVWLPRTPLKTCCIWRTVSPVKLWLFYPSHEVILIDVSFVYNFLIRFYLSCVFNVLFKFIFNYQINIFLYLLLILIFLINHYLSVWSALSIFQIKVLSNDWDSLLIIIFKPFKLYLIVVKELKY